MIENEQMDLIAGESEEAMFLPKEEAAKRYTATTAEKLEVRRNLILLALGAGFPVEYIAREAHCSTRTVNLLGAKYAPQAARSMGEMCKVLDGLALKAAFHLDQKLIEAKPGELGVIIGIMLQRKLELQAASAGQIDPDSVVNVEEVNPALVSARKRLAERQVTADQRRSTQMETEVVG